MRSRPTARDIKARSLIYPAHAQRVARFAKVGAVGKDPQRFVGHKLGVGIQIFGGGKLLLVPSFNAVDGKRLHGPDHVEQHQVQLMHFLRAVVEGLAGALDVAVLVLEIAKKNVQDFDPEVASVQHGCELP